MLLDIDGVLVVSWRPLPGAPEALHALRHAGIPVRFLTNTTSRSRAGIATALRGAGFPVADEEVLTAGIATAEYLAAVHPGARVLVLNEGPADDLGDLEVVGPGDSPDVVVIGAAGPSFTWSAMNDAARALLGGAALVAMHGTTHWLTDEGISVDGGAYVTLLERATGRTAVTIGKPAAAMFTTALTAVGARAEDAVMVGDDLRADVLAAQRVGIHGVLVRTGKFRAGDLPLAGERPDAVLDSVADLPACLGLPRG